MRKVLAYIAVIFALLSQALVSFAYANSNVPSPEFKYSSVKGISQIDDRVALNSPVTPADIAELDEFSRAFDLYWVDANFLIYKNDLQLPTTTGNFTRDKLYADGVYVESSIENGPEALNIWKLSFLGKQYDSYDGNYTRDGNLFYFIRCERKTFVAADGKNECTDFGLFKNVQKIDSASGPALGGIAPFSLRLAGKHILYYVKQLGDGKSATFAFDALGGKVDAFLPSLFGEGTNDEFLAFRENGDVLFTDVQSQGETKIMQASRTTGIQNLVIDLGANFVVSTGMMVGGHYYYVGQGYGKGKIQRRVYYEMICKLRSRIASCRGE